MAVKRIVADLDVPDPAACARFYGEGLGLELLMDQGWIATWGAKGTQQMVQVSLASSGGSDQPVPALSIEVDDLDATLADLRNAGFEPTYGPVDEPWGVRRFFVTDPAGRLVNILTHSS
ncbi:MAG: VOC family protein [Sedimentitalea sp.]